MLEGVSRVLLAVEAKFAQLARRKLLAIVLAGLIPLAGRALLLGVLPIPKPAIQDEFSYLLASDTFASGRLTNPTPAFPEHFETLQVILHPSYASKYPPLAGLVMAAGQKLAGEPWVGVWLSMGVLCAVLCWTLQGWLPAAWALAGSLIAAAHIGVVSYWTESYWGGTCAAIGGALVIGAVPRLLKRLSARPALALAAGLAILANTRPYEGLVLGAACLCWLGFSVFRGHAVGVAFRKVALPMALLLIPVFAWMGYYNYRVTGNALDMPYLEHERQYAVPSPLLWENRAPQTPNYSNTFLRDFWLVAYRGEWQHERDQLVKGHVWDLVELARFFLGWPLVLCLMVSARLLWRDPAARGALLLAACFYAGGALDSRLFPHYAAPATALAYILAACGLRAARSAWPGGLIERLYLTWGVVALFVLITGLGLLTPENRYFFGRIDYHVRGKHAAVAERLAHEPGQQLILVRYGPGHDVWEELVYNGADLEGSKVVWARSLGPDQDERLMRHFQGRKVWVLIENGNLNLGPYPTEQQGASLRYSHEAAATIAK
jgi:hypothetical protein